VKKYAIRRNILTTIEKRYEMAQKFITYMIEEKEFIFLDESDLTIV